MFIGNGVSELIDLTLRALLNPGDEVLVPSPDYPLWTAAVNLNTGARGSLSMPAGTRLRARSARRSRRSSPAARAPSSSSIRTIPPARCIRAKRWTAIARIAEKHRLVVLSDEIYDQILYDDAEFVPMATLVHGTLCCTMSGLSKVYRACGYRVGWAVFSGDVENAAEYLSGLELLCSLRLCSNVPGQWAVQTALGGYQSIRELTRPGGRLYESRQTILDERRPQQVSAAVASHGRAVCLRRGAQRRAAGLRRSGVRARACSRHKHVLVAPGVSFNVPYRNCFRITNLPEPQVLATVFHAIEELLDAQAAARPALQIVGSTGSVCNTDVTRARGTRLDRGRQCGPYRPGAEHRACRGAVRCGRAGASGCGSRRLADPAGARFRQLAARSSMSNGS